MPRNTSDELKSIFETDQDVDTFLATADLIVTEELVGQGLSDARLKQIELYLAAHFATVALEKGGLVGKRWGRSEDTFQMLQGEGLKSTRYGQQALALDTTGMLINHGVPTRDAEFRVV